MEMSSHLHSGALTLQQIDPAELSPGEFAATVRLAMDRGIRMVVIDSLNGYFHAMPGEHSLVLHMHELMTALAQRGVTTLMVLPQHGLLGAEIQAAFDFSYLSDAVLLLRFFEAEGEVRQAISMVKKRTGAHERTIRELKFDGGGLRIGEPLRQFQGVLTGNPLIHGTRGPLLVGDEEKREHHPH
jgi:circadian clock protein KaiC